MSVLFLNEHTQESAFSGLKKVKCKSFFFFLMIAFAAVIIKYGRYCSAL